MQETRFGSYTLFDEASLDRGWDALEAGPRRETWTTIVLPFILGLTLAAGLAWMISRWL